MLNSHSTHLTHPKYRPDIDGLRAIAVLSVVGFHAFPGLIKGGFIGVDIFFVISGFLIFSIIFSNLEHDSFSLLEFYRRRIKRIFPALITVMLASLLLGWFVLLADEYKQLGKHITGGAAFISNFILWQESGYFDSAAQTKPLLHLWSLAIEEQYYVFAPLVMAFAWRWKWSFIWITAAIAIFSFDANIYLMHRSPTAAFYLPIPRFWELMIGGILAYIALHKNHLISGHKNAQSVLGFVLLLLGLVLLNKEREFPGWWALLPTLGTFFVISAGSNAWLNRKLLSNKVLVWFGLISYPLYLWHWTLLSFARIIHSEILSSEIRIAAIISSIALAWLTYRFIEKPIRFGRYKNQTLALVILMLIIGCFGTLSFKTDGFKSRFNADDLALIIDKQAEDSYVWHKMLELQLRDLAGSGRKVLIIGDSFSGDLINSIYESNYNPNLQFSSLMIRIGCGNLYVNEDFSDEITEDSRAACYLFESYKNPRYLALIKKADFILLASNWKPWEVKYLHESIENIRKFSSAKILVIGAKNFGDQNVHKLIKIPKSERLILKQELDRPTIELNNRILSEVGGDNYVDIQTLLCGDNLSCPVFDENLMLLSSDGKHLTRAGAKHLGKHLLADPKLNLILQ